MKLVFIFTENGNVYSDEGMDYIRDKLKVNFQEADELVFMAGPDLNDVKTAIGLLEDHVSDGYAVISREDGIDYMPPGEGIEALAGILKWNVPGNMYIVTSEDGVRLYFLGTKGSKAVIKSLEEKMQEKTWDTLIQIMYDAAEYQKNNQ